MLPTGGLVAGLVGLSVSAGLFHRVVPFQDEPFRPVLAPPFEVLLPNAFECVVEDVVDVVGPDAVEAEYERVDFRADEGSLTAAVTAQGAAGKGRGRSWRPQLRTKPGVGRARPPDALPATHLVKVSWAKVLRSSPYLPPLRADTRPAVREYE